MPEVIAQLPCVSRSLRPWAAALAVLAAAYGRPRRNARGKPLDLFLLALLAEGHGERAALGWIEKLARRFVDWNEVRVAKPRELRATAPGAPADKLKSIQALLQALYEAMGGLDPAPLAAMKPPEVRARLAQMEILSREEIEAVLMIALGVPTLPGGEGLVRVVRRLGLAPRTATRTQAHKLALKGLAPAAYRDFYDLAGEHAATRCHANKPDCKHCRTRRLCKSKGKW